MMLLKLDKSEKFMCPLSIAVTLSHEADIVDDPELSFEIRDRYSYAMNASERLKEQATYVRGRATILLKRLDEAADEGTFCAVNSLGELQSSGPAFDVACALYAREIEILGIWLKKRFPDRISCSGV